MTGPLDPHLLHAPLLADPLADRGLEDGRPAFLHGADTLDYGTLRAAAQAGAAALAAAGCRPGDRVALALPKGLVAVRALFSILAAGAAVVPIDPTAPPARIVRMLTDAAAARLLTTGGMADALHRTAGGRLPPITRLDGPGDWDALTAGAPTHWEPPRIGPDSPAVFYYTSGTTGDPKAIALSHANVGSFAAWAIEGLGLRANDRFASHAPLHFDLTTLDLYAAVRLGASTVLLDEVTVKFPAKVTQILEETGVSVWYSVPTALMLLLHYGALERRTLDRLRLVLFAGEPFPVPHLRRLMETLPGRTFVNLYGPTETNVCTYHRLAAPPPADALAIPIGIGCEHLQVDLVREDGTPAAPGEVGEILVSGPAVMTGYWNNPALTAAARHGGDAASYRTGDLARRDADGRLWLVGRRDEQVKIRGYRVELPEIAATLVRHPSVREAVALVLAGEPARLVAAIALAQDSPLAEPDLAAHCRDWLPAYAVPEEVRVLHDLPRTSTGKVDKQSLQRILATQQ